MMRTALQMLVCSCVLTACAQKPDDPRVEFVNVGFTVHLPSAMQQALDSLAPGSKFVHINSFRSDVSQSAAQAADGMQPLFATVADFDGDGSLDAVVEGTMSGDPALRIIAIMNGAKPRAMLVHRIPLYDADAVGIYLSRPTGSGPGSFQLVDYPDSSTAYQYRNGQFVGTKVAP